ncbi:MAG: hypothetical protein AB1Z98_22525 [Nannocystaceae bacterium]
MPPLPSPTVDPALLRVPSDDAWQRLCQLAHGLGPAAIEALERALEHWPQQARRIVGTQELEDPWWTEGYEPQDQPWLGLVRTLQVGIVELLDVDSPSAWERFGFPNIRRLVLTSADRPKLAPRALARLPNIDELNLQRIMDQRRCREHVIAVAPPLRVLEAPHGRLGAHGLEVVLRHGPSLEHLDLRRNEIGPKALEVLGGWPRGARLRELLLGGNPLRMSSISKLRNTPIFDGLRQLDLDGIPGRRARFDWLSSSTLEDLRLRGADLGDTGVRAMVVEARLPSLTRLDLSGTDCRARGVAALIESGWLRRLRSLDLSSNRLGAEAIDLIVAQPRGALEEVIVDDDDLDEATKGKIAQWLGGPGETKK